MIDHQLEDLDINIKGDDAYEEALSLCAKLIDGKLEQNLFEETLRQGFRNKAFKLFTIDKVVQGLMKHCHTIVSDSKCTEILLLMEKDRSCMPTVISRTRRFENNSLADNLFQVFKFSKL